MGNSPCNIPVPEETLSSTKKLTCYFFSLDVLIPITQKVPLTDQRLRYLYDFMRIFWKVLRIPYLELHYNCYTWWRRLKRHPMTPKASWIDYAVMANIKARLPKHSYIMAWPESSWMFLWSTNFHRSKVSPIFNNCINHLASHCEVQLQAFWRRKIPQTIA